MASKESNREINWNHKTNLRKVEMSLRDVFTSVVRNKVYIMLKQGIMRDWGAELIYSLIDQAIQEKSYEIQQYLQSYVVTLENMNTAAQLVAQQILLPYILKKRVQ